MVFSYAIGPRKLSANEQFFVGAQTVVSLLPTTQIISDVCFITDHVAYASSDKPKLFETRRNFFSSFFTRGGCVSCLRACLGARLLPQSYQYPNLSEGADRVAGQLRGDKECPFSGVTKSGRVWRKVPESDARSVLPHHPQPSPFPQQKPHSPFPPPQQQRNDTAPTPPPPHTPSIAFRHPPPNSARFSYAIEGALFMSAQLSSDAVSSLRKVRVLI